MSDQRTIMDFFRQEAPEISIPENWEKLQPNTILQMYHFMCDLLFGVGDFTDSNGQPTRAACIVKLHKILCGLFGDILQGEATFSYRDLMLPEISRTRFFLVHLIQFYKFKCERQAEVDNVISELEERRRDVENEKMFEKNIEMQLKSAQENLDKLQEKRRDLEAKVYSAEKNLNDLREVNELYKADFEKKESYLDELKQKIESQQETINEANDKLKRLESDIVTSPERFIKELESHEAELKSVLAKKDDYLMELRKLERDCNDQSLATQFLDGCIDDLNELMAVKASISDIRRQADDAQHVAKDTETHLRQVTQAAADQRAKNEARIRELHGQCESLRKHVEVIHKEMEDLESDAKSLVDLQKESNKELRIVQGEIKKRNAEILLLGEQFDADVARIRDIEARMSKKADEEEAILKKIYNNSRILADFNVNRTEDSNDVCM